MSTISRDKLSPLRASSLERSARVILIPGFLTEPITHKLLGHPSAEAQGAASKGNSGLELLDSIDPSRALDSRAWIEEFKREIDAERHELSCFHWASQSLLELIGQSAQLLFRSRARLSLNLMDVAHSLVLKLHSTWQEARAQADESVEDLYEQLLRCSNEAPERPIYIVGHSLGARIALRLAALLHERPISSPVLISAWAPAINQGELDWPALSELTHPPELYHTQSDQVLKLLFKLGESSLTGVKAIDALTLTAALAQRGCAVGLIGAGEGYPAQAQVSLNDTQIGHLTYLSEMPKLFERSLYLGALRA